MKTHSIRRDFENTDFDETRALVIWNALAEPGDRVANELIRNFGARGALDAFVQQRDLGQVAASAFERWQPRYSDNVFEEKLALAQKHDLKLLLPTDPQWPNSLNDLDTHSPLLLWYRGNIEQLDVVKRSVGVVGSRNATQYGQRITGDLVATLIPENCAIVSGGALGIDSVAHRAALALGGVTIAYMAGSLDRPYPSTNFGLFDEISFKGLLLSELSPGSNPTRWRFLQRNRLIAAMSTAIVVAEAGWRSGSINTVNHACELGRPVFAIPGPITNPASAGCNRLIRDGQANLLLDVADLPSELGWRSQKFIEESGLGVLELRALDFLTRKFQSPEQLQSESGLSAVDLRIALGSLKLLGLVELGSEGGWRIQETDRK